MSLPEQSIHTFETKQVPEHVDCLAPDGSEIRLLPIIEGLGSLSYCTLPVDKVSKAVTHRTVQEIWYFLSGQGQVWRKQGDNERTVDVSDGLSLTIPLGTHFQFRNTGQEPLCFIIITMPPWPGEQEAIRVQDHWDTEAELENRSP